MSMSDTDQCLCRRRCIVIHIYMFSSIQNSKVFLLQVSVVFCFLKYEDLGVLYILVVNLAVRQGCSGDTSQLTSDVTTSFYPH